MSASAEEGTQKASELGSKLEALKAEKAQLDQELSEHQSSRETAKQDSKKAANIRAKEKAAFEETAADMSNNIGATFRARLFKFPPGAYATPRA